MRRYSKLSDHKLKKGTFITPINSIPKIQPFEDERSWTYGRMPEYIWIGLILNYYGRMEGLKKVYHIIIKIHELVPNLQTIRLSEILKLESNIQKQIFDYINTIGAKEALTPLTIFLVTSKYPVFAESFCTDRLSIEQRKERLIDVMRNIMNHQSDEATDIRFVTLYYHQLLGRFCLSNEQIELLKVYPDVNHTDEIMKKIRPLVRSLEMIILTFVKPNTEYLDYFWRSVSSLTECNLFGIEFPKEERDVVPYMENLHEIFLYLFKLYISAEPLDTKMNVLLGIAVYSYKRLKEIYEHQLFNSISGRCCIRVLIENYIMMKYLVKNEPSHKNIWREYQLYGMGAYKLVLSRQREFGVNNESHVDSKYIEALVNEYEGEEFINMNTSYFDNQNIRLKADSVDEKNLYGLYYDYDSSFEHGLWGAIRESSMLKCDNPAHKYHCVPDVEDKIVLKSVLPDCIMVMNKTLGLLDDLYNIPENLLSEVIAFGSEFFVE
jgi:hypothetical protein